MVISSIEFCSLRWDYGWAFFCNFSYLMSNGAKISIHLLHKIDRMASDW